MVSGDERRYYGLDALRGGMMVLGIVLHAAEFYLAAGKPRDALPLARENVALRQDVMSELLLARVASAAGDSIVACDARAKVLAGPLRPPELARIATSCP